MISLKLFLILQSVLVISKIGLPRRDSCREKLSVWKKQKPWNTGGRLVAFVLLGRFNTELNNLCRMNNVTCSDIFLFIHWPSFPNRKPVFEFGPLKGEKRVQFALKLTALTRNCLTHCLPLSFCTRVPTKSIFPCIFVRVAKSFFLSRVGTQSTIIKTGIIISMKNSLNSTL